MKFRLFGLLALAAAIALPAAKADTIDLYASTSATGPYTLIQACTVASCLVSGTFNGVGINGSISSNTPGTNSSALEVDSQVSFTNGSTAQTIYLFETSDSFTEPVGTPVHVVASADMLALSTAGSTVAADGYLNPTTSGASPLLMITGGCNTGFTALAVVGGPSTLASNTCPNVNPFELGLVSQINLTANADINAQQTLEVTVPEPASMMLFGSGLLGLAGVIRRKRAR